MLICIILAALVAVALCILHFGYKLAFYYEDLQSGPYEYTDDDRFVPYHMSQNIHAAAPDKIQFHTIPGAGYALNYVTAPEKYRQIVHAFTEKHLCDPVSVRRQEPL